MIQQRVLCCPFSFYTVFTICSMFIADDDYKSVTNLTIFAPSFAHIWQISTAVLLLAYFSSYLAAIGCHRAAIKS